MVQQLRVLAARLRGLFGDRRAERELEDEIETHLRLREEPAGALSGHYQNDTRSMTATVTNIRRNPMPKGEPEMTASDQNRIDVWIDGGWGVDALIGEQTRSHRDLDLAVQHRDVPRLRALLEARGFKDAPRDDTRDCNFVLGDDLGHQNRLAPQRSHATRRAAGPL